MKRVRMALCAALMLMLLSGCARVELTLLHDDAQIQEIYIVPYNALDMDHLSELPDGAIKIEDRSEFLLELRGLPFVSFLLGDPTFLEDPLAVYIVYAGGDVEVIGYMTQCYLSDGEITYRKMQCNAHDFDALMQKWVQ